MDHRMAWHDLRHPCKVCVVVVCLLSCIDGTAWLVGSVSGGGSMSETMAWCNPDIRTKAAWSMGVAWRNPDRESCIIDVDDKLHRHDNSVLDCIPLLHCYLLCYKCTIDHAGFWLHHIAFWLHIHSFLFISSQDWRTSWIR